MADDLDGDAKAVLARYLKAGMVGIMFTWDAAGKARYFGPPMRPDQLETLLTEAAKNFAPEVTGTIQ